ncbi:MAG: quinolinate synthase NadA [Eggerthellales bacterium]|nr:quinolinate synthase NadA [Eggerthellales bacterium]
MNYREEIERLKKEQDAVILAHFYVDDDVQDIADYIGDSFFLAKKAAELECETIVFCGVEFMGESAKLLNPEKRVLMPEPDAGCPMANMIYKEVIDKARAEYDDLAVVCYVNSTAEAKSWSDVCVTSSNALKIVSNLPQKNILFIPDVHLGTWLSQQLPDKHFIFNDGFCPIHESMDVQQIRDLKAEHPNAKVLVHPECPQWIRDEADYIGATSGIISQAVEGDADEYIIGTVVGVKHEIEKRLGYLGKDPADCPKKFYFPKTTPVCVNMRKITVEKTYNCLVTGAGEVQLNPETEDAARLTLTRMLEYAAK